MKLIAIVEGHGDAKAVPVLLRRVLYEKLQIYDIEVAPPIRISKNKLLKQGELERAVEFAARRTSPTDGIIVLFDADGDCPAQLGPKVVVRAKKCRPDRRISVVIAKSEFESWFVAAAESLAGCRDLPADLAAPEDAERIAMQKVGSRAISHRVRPTERPLTKRPLRVGSIWRKHSGVLLLTSSCAKLSLSCDCRFNGDMNND